MRTISLITVTVLLICNNAIAQFDGSFEWGSTFTANNWIVANDINNLWYLGAPGANGPGKGAFISSDGGYSNVYIDPSPYPNPDANPTLYSYFYTQVNFPVGFSKINLSFNWRGKGMPGNHFVSVYLVPTTVSITAGVPIDITYKIGNWCFPICTASPVDWQTATAQLDMQNLGTSKYLVFSWQTTNVGYTENPPASIDNVQLTYEYREMPLQTIILGDTIELNITGQTGQVQWEESNDSLTWVDILGFTHATERFVSTSSPTNKKFYRARITDADCSPYAPFYSSIIRHRIISDYSQFQGGDWYGGGYIISTNGSGGGKVIAAGAQSTMMAWGCNGIDIPGADDFSDGYSNTIDILNGCNERPIPASICDELQLENYSDWYLPSVNEFSDAYQYKEFIGWPYNNYWTSIEYSDSQAWFYGGSGSYNVALKTYPYNITRCIRNFNSLNKIIYSSVFAPNLYNSVQITTQPLSQNKCVGTDVNLSVETTGTGPISAQWHKDGNPIPGANALTYTIQNAQNIDNGIYTCQLENLCRSTVSNPAEVNIIEHYASFEENMRICRGGNTQVNLICTSNKPSISGAFNYAWTPVTGLSSATIYNPVLNPVVTTSYSVLLTDEIGCSTTFNVPITVGIPYEDEEICLVTVDEASGKNKITWNKTENVGTDMFLIYKETGANSYSNIGYTDASQPTEFVDIFSQPQSYANRYKLACLDTCGNESQLSYSHKTINLTLSATGSTMGLQWNDYIEESNTYIPTWYYIYRGTTPQNMAILDSISGGNGSYNDLNVFDLYYYKIGVKRDDGCNGGKSVQWAFSNPKDNSSLVNISGNELQSGTIMIAPNPMTYFTILEIPNFSNQLSVFSNQLTITDITGKVVRTEPLTPNRHPELDSGSPHARINILRGDLKPGIYFVELRTDRTYRGKLIIE